MAIWHWYYSSTASVLKSALHRNASVIGYSLTVNGLAATVEFEQDGVIYMTPRAEFIVEQVISFALHVWSNYNFFTPLSVIHTLSRFLTIFVCLYTG